VQGDEQILPAKKSDVLDFARGQFTSQVENREENRVLKGIERSTLD
jgi:hypothetical protein